MQNIGPQGQFAGRLIAGAIQGVTLYFLYEAYEAHSAVAANGFIFAPLVILALFIPLAVSQGLGNLRNATLAIWIAAAAAVIAGFAVYDIWHGWPTERVFIHSQSETLPRNLPAFGTFFFSGVFLFIAQALVIAGDAEKKFIAAYPSYFDTAWKQGLQFALAGVFVGVFWALLWLGAALFKLIDLDFLEKLIEHRWFAIPATTLAIAAALHVTDVRANLVRGARSLVLALFSWLLLLIVVIAAGFLFSLVFTGLAPLWKTRMATNLLLTAAASLAVLINAAYQDGDEERRPVKILRLASSLGGVLLLPIVTLAAYATYLRIAQYGWTADRISAVAVIVVAASYAVGYAIAALAPKAWLKRIEIWNVATSFLVLVIIAALFSPLADPMRIGVASQLARLESGKVAPEKFDVWYLRHEGGRFGKETLEKLSKSPNATLAANAKTALASEAGYRTLPEQKPEPVDLAARIRVYPAGAKLPDSFLKQDWKRDPSTMPCLASGIFEGWHCTAILRNAPQTEVVLVYGDDAPGDYKQIVLFRETDGVWTAISRFDGKLCGREYSDLLTGKFETATPIQPDLVVAGRRVAMQPTPAGECK
ncbi:hypothetical protein FHS83_001517 [Rhizomicrobium palustre]|uniref:DUF4153 domain-containing protein n=1 Tax=Rhizomicrobium palustre TaxID=189966 RepID=A0A846MY92_9PROT|nr:DUF4153 domain-containing protein [Rhizomicrobium palustre]NIK88199.1 hypothetical protein [Rhizomicrobium palustre]